MKILFIVPTPGYGLIENDQKFSRRVAGFYPPLGVAFLATVLENAGHKCKILDMQITQFTHDGLADEIKSFGPGAVCISVLTSLVPEAMKIAKIAKEVMDVPVICGGQHVSLFPKEILLQNKQVDYVIFGEGEYKLLNLIEAIEKKTPKQKVKGIYFRIGDEIIETERAPEIENLDELPIISRKFFDMEKYIPVANQYKRMPVTNMITSRGCTYAHCKYCSESGVLHQKYRRTSVGKTIEEIKMLVKDYNIKEITFWDDEFVMDQKWVYEFCKQLKQEKLDLTWSCYAKVNYVNPDILKEMASAGCWNIHYGVESGSQELLNNISKGQTLEQVRKAIKWTHDAGIIAKGSLMFGLPGETPELAEQTIQFAIDLDLDYVAFCLTTPYPGTALYADFIKENGTPDIDFSNYTNLLPVFLPKGYQSREQLVEMQRQAYKRFYLRYGYLRRMLKSINSASDVKRYLSGMYFLFKMKLLKHIKQ